MTHNNKQATALAHRVISGAVENSSPHPDARDMIEHLVRNRTRLSDDGDILITDDKGTIRISDRPGFPNLTLGEYLDELKASKPTLFSHGRATAGATELMSDPANPFSRAGWSITQQMVMLKNNPALAEKMQREAGL